MATRGFQPRSTSTQCNKCGVEWNEDKSNKQKGRAVCVECYDNELDERAAAKRKWDREHKVGPNRIELYAKYKMENRKGFWKEINAELRPLKKREEVKAFIAKQMDRILADERLMDYINSTNIVEQNKIKENDRD